MWFVYVVRASDSTLYTGIAVDVERRIREHNTNNTSGSKYLRVRRPVVLVYTEPVRTRSLALKREAEIKKLTHREKEILVGVQSISA
jgi:putative endonuclease